MIKSFESHLTIRFILFSMITLVTLNGCMMMGMHMGRNRNYTAPSRLDKINKGNLTDQMVDVAVEDLKIKKPNIKSIAVWQIQSKTSGIDNEVIREKLITRLVNSNHFTVVSRQRLQELLQEQSLSLSGVITEENAAKMGALIGVEGFIDGYSYLENERFILSLKLIETKSGVIVWAKTIER